MDRKKVVVVPELDSPEGYLVLEELGIVLISKALFYELTEGVS